MSADLDSPVAALSALIDELPEDLRRQALTHSSWTELRIDSYERLAFLGDSVLELAIAKELYDRYPDASEGRLAKIRSHVVSRQSCAAVARELRLGERLGEAAGEALAGFVRTLPEWLARERATGNPIPPPLTAIDGGLA